MNEEEKKKLLPEKYHPLIDGKLSVQYNPEKNEINFFFIGCEDLRRFLVLYEPDDFTDKNLIIMSSGECQGCHQQEFIVSHQFLLINSLRAKIAEALKQEMLVHLCEECQAKIAGGKKKMIWDMLSDMHKIKEDPNISEKMKEDLLEAASEILYKEKDTFEAFLKKMLEGTENRARP